MKTSKQARRDGKRLYQCCLVDGRLDEDRVRAAVREVVRAKPRGWLALLHHLQRLVHLAVDRRTARVESPLPLDEAERGALRSKLEGLHGAGLAFEFVHNPALLGGLRVRVGSDVYDGSVESRLNLLEQSF